jgi:hypothetical protein
MLLEKRTDADLLCRMVGFAAQRLMEPDVRSKPCTQAGNQNYRID